jgi:formylglycine-generating enzyme required for sulfatase activity
MKLPINKKSSVSILLLIVMMLATFTISETVLAQQKFDRRQILNAIAAVKEGRTTNRELIERVKRVGVSFQLTAENEQLLREEGASNELIEAIRQNSPPVQGTVKPTPKEKPTPDNRNTPTGNTFRNSIGMEFVKIPAGSFMMGSPASEANRADVETQHRVTISRDFYMGKYEVSQAQWTALMGTNPSGFKGDNLPVERVSWDDAQEFIKKLNARGEGTYRLPTEAEWEYAARAGTMGAFGIGNGDSLSSEQANFDGNYPYGNTSKGKWLQKTAPVGSYRANAWGLYDMHGNVWEWCQDWFGAYPSGSVKDPTGATSGSVRVDRGGGWNGSGEFLRSAFRLFYSPSLRGGNLGFRLVREN